MRHCTLIRGRKGPAAAPWMDRLGEDLRSLGVLVHRPDVWGDPGMEAVIRRMRALLGKPDEDACFVAPWVRLKPPAAGDPALREWLREELHYAWRANNRPGPYVVQGGGVSRSAAGRAGSPCHGR